MPWILGTIAALYVSRIVVEFSPAAWPTIGVWIAAIVLALLALVLSIVANAFGCEMMPLAALALYVISPVLDPTLAGATGSVAALGVLILAVGHPGEPEPNDRWRTIYGQRGRVSDSVVFLASFVLYAGTLAPGLLPADSGEFQVVAPTLGVAHPPGYALYTMVGWLFTLIPVGTPAYRLNLLSAVLAASTLAIVNSTTRRLTRSMAAGLIAATALAGAPTFWAQATTANIRMPTALFTALILWLLLRLGQTGAGRYLILAAFTFGLALTHHGSLAFLAPVVVVYILWVRPRVWQDGRLVVRAAVAFALALLVLLYFPIRGAADAPLAPGGLTTLDGFLYHVLARGFRGDVLALTGRQVVADRLRVLFNILIIQFGWPLFLITGIGLVAVVASRWRAAPGAAAYSAIPRRGGLAALVLIGAACGVMAAVAITYRAPQTVEYLMPAYVALVLLAGVGTVGLARLLPAPPVAAVVLALALVLAAGRVWQAAPSFRALSAASDTRATVEPVLEDAPQDALILSNWHWATAFWYLQIVEGMRPDVAVEYVAPAGAEPYPETWRRRIATALDAGRPVVTTNRYATYAQLPARLVPIGSAFRVAQDAAGIPATATPLEAQFGLRQAQDPGPVIGLQAYSMSHTQLEPGDSLAVRLWWQPLVDAQRDYSVFIHLVDASGQPVGQADARYGASRLTAGVLVQDVYTLAILPTTPPGDYELVAGFYFTPAEGGFERLITDGNDAVQLATVIVTPQHTRPATQHPLEAPFASGPTLIGVDYDTGWSAATRAYLHWQSAEAGPSTGLGTGPWVASLLRGGEVIGATPVPAASPGTFVTSSIDFPHGTPDLALVVAPSDGEALPALGAWRLPLLGQAKRLPLARPEERFLVFGRAMALIGADWRWAGNDVIVDLEWLALAPLTDDYTVSVQLAGESGWRAQDDGTPALGAIPTLKWIRGMRVLDRHRVSLPDNAGGPAAIQISVYDAFTQRPLGVLDDRFRRIGQGQAAVIGSVAP